jgi:proline dehydrogenase
VEVIADRGIDSTVSLKLSQLGLTVDGAACAANLARILERAKELGVGVEVDMEQSDLVGRTLDVFREAIGGYPQTAWPFRRACVARRPMWSHWPR